MVQAYLTAGYSGHTPDQLERVMQVLKASVVDIRMKAGSSIPGWNGWDLKKRLGWHRYRHIPEFGNVNYKGEGGIQIADFEKGFDTLIKERHQAVILICGCKSPDYCHRTVVAGMLRQRVNLEYVKVEELDWNVESDHPQEPLFTDEELGPEVDWKTKLGYLKRRPTAFISRLGQRFPDSDMPKDLWAPEIEVIETTPSDSLHSTVKVIAVTGRPDQYKQGRLIIVDEKDKNDGDDGTEPTPSL